MPDVNVSDFAFLWGGALLAATTQGPISGVVLMLELTGRVQDFALPMVAAAMVATLTSRPIVAALDLRSAPERRSGGGSRTRVRRSLTQKELSRR
jgi:H+/Cl- antiporter ClcA